MNTRTIAFRFGVNAAINMLIAGVVIGIAAALGVDIPFTFNQFAMFYIGFTVVELVFTRLDEIEAKLDKAAASK